MPLAFAMTAYTYGPMLGLFLLALFVPKHRVVNPKVGVLVSLPIQPTGSINRALPRCRARVFYFFSSKDFCCET